MNPALALKSAEKAPHKNHLGMYLDHIWTLHSKGYSTREIAKFLINLGVKTEHTAVHRLIAKGHPVFYNEERILIGETEYECRKGFPLHPFKPGNFIKVTERVNIIRLEDSERIDSSWCEAQFRLNSVPNNCWLYQLSKELNLLWTPEDTRHLRSRSGFELKFEGDLMALVCGEFNLATFMRDVGKAISKATKSLMDTKSSLKTGQELRDSRKKQILALHFIPPGVTEEEILEQDAQWRAEKQATLEKQFKTNPMS